MTPPATLWDIIGEPPAEAPTCPDGIGTHERPAGDPHPAPGTGTDHRPPMLDPLPPEALQAAVAAYRTGDSIPLYEWLSENHQQWADLEDELANNEIADNEADAARLMQMMEDIEIDIVMEVSPPDALPIQPRPPAPTRGWPESALPPAPSVKPAAPPAKPPKRKRRDHIADYEQWLRKNHTPYVAVDEARRAMRTEGTALRSFHFVVYSSDDTPNLLVFVNRGGREVRDLMTQWARIFGKGFAPAIARRHGPNGWRHERIDV